MIALGLCFAEQLRQLGDIRRDPPRFSSTRLQANRRRRLKPLVCFFAGYNDPPPRLTVIAIQLQLIAAMAVTKNTIVGTAAPTPNAGIDPTIDPPL
jgi:hypothetical protein